MTKPSEGQFSNLCDICGKKLTAKHTHANQSPEEIAKLMFGEGNGAFCPTCGLPGSQEEHIQRNFHTLPQITAQNCAACGKPGSFVSHELSGEHLGLSKVSRTVSKTKGSNAGEVKTGLVSSSDLLSASGTTAQRKNANVEAVKLANEATSVDAEGNPVPQIQYQDSIDPTTGQQVFTALRGPIDTTGIPNIDKLRNPRTALGKLFRGFTKAGTVRIAYNDSGTTTASTHAAKMGAELSQPHRAPHYTATLSLHPGVQKSKGIKTTGQSLVFAPHEITPGVKEFDHTEAVADWVTGKLDEKGNFVVDPTGTEKKFMQSTDENGNPLTRTVKEKVKGVYAGPFFYRDSEIHNLEYNLKPGSPEREEDQKALYDANMAAEEQRGAQQTEAEAASAAKLRAIDDRKMSEEIAQKKASQAAHESGEHGTFDDVENWVAAVHEAHSRIKDLVSSGKSLFTTSTGLVSGAFRNQEPRTTVERQRRVFGVVPRTDSKTSVFRDAAMQIGTETYSETLPLSSEQNQNITSNTNAFVNNAVLGRLNGLQAPHIDSCTACRSRATSIDPEIESKLDYINSNAHKGSSE